MALPEENYPLALRNYLFAQAEGLGKAGKVQKISLKRILSFVGAPARSTFYRWKRQRRLSTDGVDVEETRGRPALLSEVEKLVIGGWALQQLADGHAVTIATLTEFIEEAFRLHSLRPAHISQLMAHLKFSSRKTRSVTPARREPEFERAMAQFIEEVREELADGFPLRQLVAVDQVSFWDSPSVLRSYAPMGCGQPAVVEPKKSHKDVLYSGLCADGSVITPVLFTSDSVDTHESSDRMPVVYQQGLKGPGNQSTLKWWDLVKDRDDFERAFLLLDNLKAHHSKAFTEELSSYDVTVRYFPAQAGSLLNPCDNSFHADLKHRYFGRDRSSHAKMIAAIRESYHETPEATIVNYWRHTGYTSTEAPSKVAKKLNSEGWWATGEKGARLQAMRDAYLHWKLNSDLARRGEAPFGSPLSLGIDGLDGVYWTQY